ncbi:MULTISPECIES: GNAT family N-acetyltransferase [unclassified Rhodococcus (in: high G+C Gram-positive bacteria)]|uniref:GNAT family protein n=1 Tax=Rhodococcus cercidiphylli TaxID=489916 RepID=A0ABU4B0J2_9NOCA|nr:MULTISPECIES: GNAT family protein [unclassified Rhodococcus (in: high G+C Gram-positive bacteria)]KAA0922827.1 GNAT family N-acetyltransferase [Rhodococcus sp. ANT_H53B]MDV6232008.1 GNAT family protein [Rhodococcus cercidiphylli]MDV7990131.1 GNAT family protein [Rhodococcus sp. IEGM 1374]
MHDAPSQRIVTDRLVIRREEADDACAVADVIGRNLVHLSPWMGWATAEAARTSAQLARIADAVEQWDAGKMFDYGIFDLEGGAFLGKIGMHRRIGPHGIELGYWLDARAEGRGVISEAVAALMREALRLDGIIRVEIHCDAANFKSQAVPRRLGFVLDRIEDQPIAAASETGEHMVWVYQPDRR